MVNTSSPLNEPQDSGPEGQRPTGNVNDALPKEQGLKPLAAFSSEIVLPQTVHDRVTLGDWLGATLRPLKTEVIGAFEEAIGKNQRLSDDERAKLSGAMYLAVDELLVNVACYGLAGITSDQRVAAYLDGSSAPELEATIRQRLADPEIRARRGSVTLEVFADHAHLTVYDGTPFSDFKERWARADEAILEENLCRRSGRGLFLIQSSGFTAEQAPGGAVMYTLRW